MSKAQLVRLMSSFRQLHELAQHSAQTAQTPLQDLHLNLLQALSACIQLLNISVQTF